MIQTGIAHMFTKRKVNTNPEQVAHTQERMSNFQQTEAAEIMSRLNHLSQDESEIKLQKTKDESTTITALKHKLVEMKTYTATLINSFGNIRTTYT